uniref:Putative secreted protein n=1 Tax=Amblyomma tuberculatum TaxID=48802 RepID=A0A6M2E440_9ACAR
MAASTIRMLTSERKMLLLLFFIVGFGHSVAKGDPPSSKSRQSSTKNIYATTFKMVRGRLSLRLLMYSPPIGDVIPRCLISKYIKTNTDGADRTLKTDNKLETKQNGKENKAITLNATIKIVVTNSSQPYLQFTFKNHSSHQVRFQLNGLARNMCDMLNIRSALF